MRDAGVDIWVVVAGFFIYPQERALLAGMVAWLEYNLNIKMEVMGSVPKGPSLLLLSHPRAPPPERAH